MIAMIRRRDQSCWLAEAWKILLLLLYKLEAGLAEACKILSSSVLT